MEKAEGKEGIATVDASKVKNENLEVAGGKCLRGKWLSVLNVTGEMFNCSPSRSCITIKTEESARNMLFQSKDRNLFQRPGSCLLPYCLLWWPTQSSPLSSTTSMADLNSFVSMIRDDINKYFNNNSTTSQQLLYHTSKVIHFNF